MHLNSDTMAMIFGILFAISEGLAVIPVVEANSVFQVLHDLFKKLAGK